MMMSLILPGFIESFKHLEVTQNIKKQKHPLIYLRHCGLKVHNADFFLTKWFTCLRSEYAFPANDLSKCDDRYRWKVHSITLAYLVRPRRPYNLVITYFGVESVLFNDNYFIINNFVKNILLLHRERKLCYSCPIRINSL